MGAAYLSISVFVVVFAACIAWASRGEPLSEFPREDEMSAGRPGNVHH